MWSWSKLEQREKRNKQIIKYMKDYINTYDSQAHFKSYEDETIIDDMVYMIGVALYNLKGVDGYGKWRKILIEYME